MEPIIPPVDRELLRAELTPERKARDTKKAGNEIYIFPASECPALMREIGRLREIAFRGAGGGTGREVDIDAEDLAEDGYYQLIVWDPAAGEIVGGYRFIICTDEYPRHAQPPPSLDRTLFPFQRQVSSQVPAPHHRAGTLVRAALLPGARQRQEHLCAG